MARGTFLGYLLFYFRPCLTFKCHLNHQDKLGGIPKGSHEGRWLCWTVLVLSFCFVFWHYQLGMAVDSLMHALLTHLNLIGSSIHDAFNCGVNASICYKFVLIPIMVPILYWYMVTILN